MQPNLLLIVSDQLSSRALSLYGHDFARTPNLDRLAGEGVHCGRAVTPCPLCRPARASFWTGRHPHATGVLSNGRWFSDEPVGEDVPTLGSLLTAAGYDCVHFGKTHDHGALRGFCHVETGVLKGDATAGYAANDDTWRDLATVAAAEQWLGESHNEPWCCVVDLQNPHNICGFVGENAPGCIAGDLPELPVNLATPGDLPLPLQHLCCSHRRQWQTLAWDDTRWRQYRAAYCHFVEHFDGSLGRIVAARDARDDAADTCTVLWADHGDAMGAHRLVTKHTSFYEEVVNVPLLFSGAGVTARGRAVGDPLVSLIDLVPTLCGLAGAPAPADLPGQDLVPLLAAHHLHPAREWVTSQWHTEWGSTIEPGRMLRSQRFKYVVYREGDGEQFFDLENDPGETRNLVTSPAHASELARHRAWFDEWLSTSGDPFRSLEPDTEERWRAHPPGAHQGTCAPIAWAEGDRP